MLHHDDLALIIARQRQSDLQEAAEKHRLLKMIEANEPAIRKRVLLAVAKYLICNGTQLRRRVQAASRQHTVSTCQVTESGTNG